jgi:frataxin-like iron-binding protein CyaY
MNTHNKQLKNNSSGDQMIDFQTKLIDKLIEKSNSINTTLTNSNSNNSNNTINTKNQNVYNYIVNNVKPSTNVQIELEKPLTPEEIINIKDKSPLEGSYDYIHNRLINKRDYDERLLICSDISRNKFSYYNENNEWVIDMKLKNLLELIFDKISKIVQNQLEFKKNKYDYEKFLEETLKQINLYNELKNTLKEKPTKLLNKLYKDTQIDDNYILKHKNLVDKNN